MPTDERRKGLRGYLSLGVISLGWTALAGGGGCARRDTDLERRADTVERQGDLAARQLRDRADEVAHAASVSADELRHRAGDAWNNLPSVQNVAPGARGGGPVALDVARDQYAAARCDREERCNNVGPSRTHASRAACLTETRQDRRDTWDTADCRAGINSAHLAECLSAVRGQACNNPIDDLTRLSTCRGGEVCSR